MKILNINSYFEQDFYKNLFNEIKKLNIDLKVVVPCAYNDERYDYLKDNYDVLNCYKKIDRFFIKRKIKKISKVVLDKYDISSFDLIHAHSLISNGGPAYEVYKKTGKPYVVAVRASDVYGLNKMFFYHYFYFKKIILNASKIIFISYACQQAFLKFFKGLAIRKKIEECGSVVSNGIDDRFFDNESSLKTHELGTPLNLLFCGVNRKRKNTLFVAKTIKKYCLNCIYTIVGKRGSKRLESKLAKYPFVKRIDNLSIPELIDIYKRNDAFIMASKRETFGLTYIEALSRGLPIIYSKGTGIDGFFPEGEVGYHVKIGSKSDLKQKILILESQYNSIASRCVNASKRFKWQDIALQYRDIYSIVLKDGGM